MHSILSTHQRFVGLCNANVVIISVFDTQATTLTLPKSMWWLFSRTWHATSELSSDTEEAFFTNEDTLMLENLKEVDLQWVDLWMSTDNHQQPKLTARYVFSFNTVTVISCTFLSVFASHPPISFVQHPVTKIKISAHSSSLLPETLHKDKLMLQQLQSDVQRMCYIQMQSHPTKTFLWEKCLIALHVGGTVRCILQFLNLLLNST